MWLPFLGTMLIVLPLAVTLTRAFARTGEPEWRAASAAPLTENDLFELQIDLALTGDDVMDLFEWEAKRGFR